MKFESVIRIGTVAFTLALAMGLMTTPSMAEAHEKNTQDSGLTYVGTKDFTDLKAGEAPYYIDKWRKVLAINAGNVKFRDKWARATTEFVGADGTYNVTITTIGEYDGECTYRLYVDDELIGELQNDAVDKSGDMKPQTHVWEGVAVKQGQTIGVESNLHTNGKIPEGDGTAWARGRWLKVDFKAAE
ncbi:MAG: hypothetical protein AAGA25_10740 [Planctomycetota bacterium]